MKNRRTDYFILFIVLCAAEFVVLVYTVMQPRPTHIFFVVFLAVLCILSNRWSQKDKCGITEGEYKKAVKEWKRRKKEADKNRDSADQNDDGLPNLPDSPPAKPKNMAPGIMTIVLVSAVILYLSYFFLIMTELAFPYHAVYEYKRDIAHCKESGYYGPYSFFFPDEIPSGAGNVKWIMRPSFLQGSGINVLIFQAPEGFIDSVIAEYGDMAVISPEGKGYLLRIGESDPEDEYYDEFDQTYNDMPFGNYYDADRLDELVVYIMADNHDWNHRHRGGFFVDEERKVIGFYCE